LKILYLSYDGMTDPLGQSQVLPYLEGLAGAGHEIWLISFEKPERFSQSEQLIRSLIKGKSIYWHPEMYTAKPPVISTLKDVRRLKKSAKRLIQEFRIEAVHCRSYITALAGLEIKRRLKLKFVFDMRGFWADERIDGGIWKLSNPVFSNIYKFFKKKEKQFLLEADAVVSLTQNAADEIHSWAGMENVPITVIPCCADLHLYQAKAVDDPNVLKWRKMLDLSAQKFVLSYLGSLGTWYMLNEMLDYFSVLLKVKPDAVFLFITPDNPEMIIRAAADKGIPKAALRILKAARKEVPEIAALSTVSIFFIKPSFSKKASSPTKMGELMAAGIPLIVNAGVGDVETILRDGGNGHVIGSFSTENYRESVDRLDALLKSNPANSVACANRWYSLNEGVNRYKAIYQKFEAGS
jgi:glycosyltransferase involved in cell wall biosynthesis